MQIPGPTILSVALCWPGYKSWPKPDATKPVRASPRGAAREEANIPACGRTLNHIDLPLHSPQAGSSRSSGGKGLAGIVKGPGPSSRATETWGVHHHAPLRLPGPAPNLSSSLSSYHRDRQRGRMNCRRLRSTRWREKRDSGRRLSGLVVASRSLLSDDPAWLMLACCQGSCTVRVSSGPIMHEAVHVCGRVAMTLLAHDVPSEKKKQGHNARVSPLPALDSSLAVSP